MLNIKLKPFRCKVNVEGSPRVTVQTVNPLKPPCETRRLTTCRDTLDEEKWKRNERTQRGHRRGEMTDLEVKCHGMEANTAVGIVDNQVLERSPFNWLVNKRKRKKGTFPTKRWQVSHCETPSDHIRGSSQRPNANKEVERVKIPPTFPRLNSLQREVYPSPQEAPPE